MKTKAPIGIFDSGLGGLTVAAAVKELMPDENIIYLGDTARVPYGDKSPETVLRFGCEDAHFLAGKGVKLIIVACNTVSSSAIDGIREDFKAHNIDIPLIGVLEAGVEAILQENNHNRNLEPEHCTHNTKKNIPNKNALVHIRSVAVIGTRGTVNSNAYSRELRRKAPELTVKSIACPLFAPIVEEGLSEHSIAATAIDIYLKELKKTPADALLLGCTHYPLLINALKNYLPDSVKIIDSAHAVANLAEKFLNKNSLKNNSENNAGDEFYVTDSPETFAEHAEKFLGRSIRNVSKVKINKMI